MNDNSLRNNISIDPFGLFFGSIQGTYERSISSSMSIGLNVGYKYNSGIFSVEGIDIDKISTKKFEFSGIKIIPEFRWYLEKGGMTGFYIGGYLKYQNYKTPIEGIYTDNNYQTSPIDLVAQVKTTAVGLQVGYKLVIKKKFFADFLIAGPGFGSNTFEIKENKPLPQGFYNDLNDALEIYNLYDNYKLDVKFDTNQKTDKINLPTFRYGIKVGYMF
ncbi:DUF3575 domain-containing protein [Chryseobacterium aquaeductus]|nr:DUF3575 domain-containing protein [Chryseobacterium aquaeductus]